MGHLIAHYKTASQDYITLGDALKMGERAVDQLHPYLSNLVNNLNKIGSVESDHDSKMKVKEWYVPVVSVLSQSTSARFMVWTFCVGGFLLSRVARLKCCTLGSSSTGS